MAERHAEAGKAFSVRRRIAAALSSLVAWCRTDPVRALVASAAIPVTALALRDVAQRLVYEAHGPSTADTAIYAGVGRGILNHVPLYSGLFETKPPLIFLLFALSWKLVGSWALVTWAQVAAIAAIFLTPVGLVLRERRGIEGFGAKVTLAVLGGASIALYTAVRAGEIQVESFGAATLVPWVWICTRRPDRAAAPSRWRLLTGSVSVAVACMTKEPFLFSAIAVALINMRSRRDAIEFSAMLGLAGLLDVLALLLTGAFGGYFLVYLPEMLNGAFATGPIHGDSLMLRAFQWGHLWDDLSNYAPGLVVALAGAAVSLMSSERSAGLTPFSIVARWASAVSISALAVGLSGRYYNHHFVLMVPLAMGVLATWLVVGDRPSREAVGFGSAVAVFGLVAATAAHDRPELGEQLAKLKGSEESARAAAAQIDRALDCMHEQRYMYIGTNGFEPWGWTVHSPVGPFFFQYDDWFAGSQRRHRDELLGELKQARLLVFRSLNAGDFNDPLRKAIAARFRPGLPAECASIAPVGPWTFEWAEH